MDEPDELAAQAAYAAFLKEVRAWLPHDGSPWDELPMPLKQAWTAAARAAREIPLLAASS